MPSARQSPGMHPRILLALVALVLLVGTALAPGSGAAARAPGPLPEPLGVWPLTPVPEVLAGFDPPDQPWGAGHRGVDLAGSPGQVGPRRPGRHRPLRRAARRPGRRGGRPRRHPDHLRARPRHRRRGGPRRARAADRHARPRGRPLPAPRLPALGLAPGRRLPRSAGPRRRRAGAAAAVVARLSPAPLQAGPPLVPWPFAGWWPAVLLLTPAGAPAGRPSAADRW